MCLSHTHARCYLTPRSTAAATRCHKLLLHLALLPALLLILVLRGPYTCAVRNAFTIQVIAVEVCTRSMQLNQHR
jgi:hypothetical protein